MEVKSAHLFGEGSKGEACSSSRRESYGRDQPGPLAGSLAALMSVIGDLFDNMAHFHDVAAELPPEDRTWFGPEDVARAGRLLLGDSDASE